jgi:TatD DNase family protein
VNPLADTHCHLDFEAFEPDREQVLARALDLGVMRILAPGIDLPSSAAVVELAQRFNSVYAAVGVHPNSGQSWTSTTAGSLRELASQPKVVAVGEVGLDFYRDATPRPVQSRIFQEQLELAAELGLPVIIHSRDSADQVLDILEEWRQDLIDQDLQLAARPGVLHSFSGSSEQAHRALAAGFFLGFTGPVTFRKADGLRQLLAEVPLDRVLVETDAPFLTPHPHRGKRNEPAFVRNIADKIAEVQGKPPEIVAQATTANAQRIFDWGDSP